MSKILDEIITNLDLLADIKKRPKNNLIKVQTKTGSNYLGYIIDNDEEGVLFEPLFDDYYPAYIFKRDIKKIIIPTTPEEEKEILRKERSWFSDKD